MKYDASSEKIIHSVRLDEASLKAILQRIEDQLRPDQRKGWDAAERFKYPAKACVVYMQQPGAGSAIGYSVPPYYISANEFCFLHGGFVHIGTRCFIQLVTLHGTWQNVKASVAQVDFLEGNIHTITVKFDEPVDPSNFCASALKVKVLHVVDDVSLARLASFFLEQLNAMVDVAENGSVAIDLAIKNKYGLILMDMDMSVVDGFEATTELRKNGYAGLIVATTAKTRPEDHKRCVESGCDLYITKPYDQATLADLLHKLKQEPLLSLYHDDSSMAGIICEFVEELPDLMRSVQEAFLARDGTQFGSAVRRLKYLAGGYGFEPIMECAADIEAKVQDGASFGILHEQMNQLTNLCHLAKAPSKPDHTKLAGGSNTWLSLIDGL